MHDLTLEGLLGLGSSWFANNEAEWLIIHVQVEDNEPEIIINPKANFKAKLTYYAKAYNNDLTLKANPDIKIVKYDMVDDLRDVFC